MADNDTLLAQNFDLDDSPNSLGKLRMQEPDISTSSEGGSVRMIESNRLRLMSNKRSISSMRGKENIPLSPASSFGAYQGLRRKAGIANLAIRQRAGSYTASTVLDPETGSGTTTLGDTNATALKTLDDEGSLDIPTVSDHSISSGDQSYGTVIYHPEATTVGGEPYEDSRASIESPLWDPEIDQMVSFFSNKSRPVAKPIVHPHLGIQYSNPAYHIRHQQNDPTAQPLAVPEYPTLDPAKDIFKSNNSSRIFDKSPGNTAAASGPASAIPPTPPRDDDLLPHAYSAPTETVQKNINTPQPDILTPESFYPSPHPATNDARSHMTSLAEEATLPVIKQESLSSPVLQDTGRSPVPDLPLPPLPGAQAAEPSKTLHQKSKPVTPRGLGISQVPVGTDISYAENMIADKRKKNEILVVHRPQDRDKLEKYLKLYAGEDIEETNETQYAWRSLATNTEKPQLMHKPRICPRQVSGVFLAFFVICPPLWILLGWGQLDKIVGNVDTQHKRIAKALAGLSSALVAAAMISGFVIG
ncbi:hypothetical protein CANCADRAFT_144984 [Tortispora caseinolytica NRRL Y-17796]|uniref:Uncharacterized protein n=1 Tax=Tortispora caseinolytica NRRL Y-17796 TaxID=767744 RepID=A0A1E4T9A0_9ASCO|nr:hypothetical protein CANCADRAFT_144984 [Tortispora caseinolytica NRRL Y-17796]